MLSFLLMLLLLQESPSKVSDEVCFNMSNGALSVNVVHPDPPLTLHIHDETHQGGLTCDLSGISCFVECVMDRHMTSQNSTFCLEADVTAPPLEFSIPSYGHCSTQVCTEMSIRPVIAALHNSHSNQTHLLKLFTLREMCSQLFSENRDIQVAFINAERQMIHNIMRLVQLQPGASSLLQLTGLVMSVISISDANVAAAPGDGRIQIHLPEMLPQDRPAPQLWLPVDALRSIPEAERTIGVVVYDSHAQFELGEENIVSEVMRLELLGERRLHDLNTTVKMVFRVSTLLLANDSHFRCHYFDEEEYVWRTDGCETDSRASTNSTDVECSCNHTTPFAVLMIRESISAEHWQVLSTLSYVGCSLSAIFSALALLLFIFSKGRLSDDSLSIHASLSAALFLLNVTFLCVEWASSVELAWVCELVGAATHFSLLCYFTWMAIEGFHLYLQLIKVFNIHYRHYFLKLSLAGWGIPGVVVAVSLGVKEVKQVYGLTHLTMAETNQTNTICWIIDETFSYSLNLVYFTPIFIFNLTVLLRLSWSICRIRRAVAVQAERASHAHSAWNTELCRSSLTMLGLTVLMGPTWGLVFLGSGYVNYPVLYLFCILNSTQGVFIFLWIVLTVRKRREREADAKTSSSTAKTSAVKAE